MSGPAPAGGSALRRLLSTGGGLGWLPWAPGTWASAATALAFAALFGLEGVHAGLVQPSGAVGGALPLVACVLLVLAGIAVAGIWLGQRAAQDFGVEDPGAFVLDEVVGQGLALLPLLPGPVSGWGLLLAFALFRAFDIIKPPPCARLERLHGGVGIMADDVMAGVYAAVLVAVLPV